MRNFWLAIVFLGIGGAIGAWLTHAPPCVAPPVPAAQPQPQMDSLTTAIHEYGAALLDYEESLTHAMQADQKQEATCHAVRAELRQQVVQFDQALLEIHELLEQQQ